MQSISAKFAILVEQSGSGRHGHGRRNILLNPRDSFGIRAQIFFF
jgi:hypothetical protein